MLTSLRRSKRSSGHFRFPGSEKQATLDTLNFQEAEAEVSDQNYETERFRKRQCYGLLHSQYSFIDSQTLSTLPVEDATFLSAKGAVTLPDEAAMEEFVYQYFKRVHPSVPMIDEAEFWRIYHNRLPGNLSLFVFQAILFASCPFVSLETLRRCGFENKRDARKQLYNRAKLLFDLKAETKPSAKAKGAVLLTHHTSAEDPQAGSLWLTRAIESAMMIDAQPSLLVDDISPSLKKRLWWSILLRDRSLCIGLRRRPQVPIKYCDWITEDDFMDEIYSSRAYDPNEKRRLLTALQEQCQLAVLLSDLVSLIFAPRVFPSCFLSVDQFDGLMLTIDKIRLSLVEWENQTLSTRQLMERAESDDPAAMLTALTSMYYQYDIP
ncbi:hypothetical protein PHISCL_06837 [Aspergillus sclerotialis]|uniref:Transcription factor domain-containing protein n=1 Tax=Aspergillus sclerotialis TaxID=2070753 RepID=A0A3A2ZCG7_9EURO|nr:hypothetical protein PHISCL_06837 [Aspergillus sclerotialis]